MKDLADGLNDYVNTKKAIYMAELEAGADPNHMDWTVTPRQGFRFVVSPVPVPLGHLTMAKDAIMLLKARDELRDAFGISRETMLAVTKKGTLSKAEANSIKTAETAVFGEKDRSMREIMSILEAPCDTVIKGVRGV